MDRASRWGGFPGTDSSARYSAESERHGKQISNAIVGVIERIFHERVHLEYSRRRIAEGLKSDGVAPTR